MNIYKLPNPQARNSNYEQILRILNDALQGTAEGCGFLFGGTPEFLLDPRRGLFSYPALASRLEENRFATKGLADFSAPVLRLASLSPEDLYVLLAKLRHVFAGGDTSRYLVPDEALPAFMLHCQSRIGESYFRTPRTTIRSFIDFLSILEQNPDADWHKLVDKVEVAPDVPAEEDNFTGGEGASVSETPASAIQNSVENTEAAISGDEDEDSMLVSLRLG